VAAGAAGLKAEVLICPPATLIAPFAQALAGAVALGGQDCHEAAKGAFTGDIAAAMLKDAGAGYVILGHSERRLGYRETSHRVRAKAEAALAAGLNHLTGCEISVSFAGETVHIVGLGFDETDPASIPDSPPIDDGALALSLEAVAMVAAAMECPAEQHRPQATTDAARPLRGARSRSNPYYDAASKDKKA
jgi:hypothetical protein